MWTRPLPVPHSLESIPAGLCPAGEHCQISKWICASAGKEPTCQCRRCKKVSVTGLGRSLGAGNNNSLQHSCLESPMDRGAWWATVLGAAKSQTQLACTRTTEHFSTAAFAPSHGVSGSACKSFKSRFSVCYHPLSIIGFQTEMFWGLISHMLVWRVRVPDVERTLCFSERRSGFVGLLLIAGCCAECGDYGKTASRSLLPTSAWLFSHLM